MKYEFTIRECDYDKTYVFVTRGRSKPFTDSEIEAFFLWQQDQDESKQEDVVEETKESIIPDHLIRVFLKDITEMGVKFCASKYGASEHEIVEECGLLFPHIVLKSKE